MATGVFVNARDLSKQGDKLVREIGTSGDTCYITKGGRAKAVLLDIQRYNAMMDLLEEAELPNDLELKPENAGRLSVRGILRESSSSRRSSKHR